MSTFKTRVSNTFVEFSSGTAPEIIHSKHEFIATNPSFSHLFMSPVIIE